MEWGHASKADNKIAQYSIKNPTSEMPVLPELAREDRRTSKNKFNFLKSLGIKSMNSIKALMRKIIIQNG